jgi:hypothetical protein
MRKLFSKYNLIATVIVVQLIASGCKDSLLDVEPRDRLTETTLWGDKGSTTLFLNDVYEGLPDGNNWYDPVENWSDNSICGFPWPGSRKIVQEMLMNPTSIPGGDVGNIYAWATNYANIRKCNVYIKNVTASNLDTDFKKTTLAEVRVLRAYYYQMLYMAYGGMPIITEVLDQAQGDAIFKPRSTADETLQFITKECTEAYVDLPETPMSGSVGKATAMVLKGWVELYAGKWAEAAASNKKIIDELTGYNLEPDYLAFFLKKGNESKESIFYREYIATVKAGRIDGTCGPTFTGNGAETSWGGVNPTQELVDDYAMDNGKIITDPTSGYDPQKPYERREQRFYQSINFDGCYWYNINLSMRDNATNAIDLADKNDASQTGYYMRKRLNDKLVLGAPAWTSATAQSNQNYNIFRYAEVLLNYAEAQNEAIGADASVYIAIGKIRTRAGLPNLPEGLSQADMRTAIRRERRIELALEDKRYWDLIRWKIAEVNLNKPLHGMKITTSGATVTYTVVPAVGGNRKFAPKNYLFPIPQDVINQNKQIKGNNPGY